MGEADVNLFSLKPSKSCENIFSRRINHNNHLNASEWNERNSSEKSERGEKLFFDGKRAFSSWVTIKVCSAKRWSVNTTPPTRNCSMRRRMFIRKSTWTTHLLMRRYEISLKVKPCWLDRGALASLDAPKRRIVYTKTRILNCSIAPEKTRELESALNVFTQMVPFCSTIYALFHDDANSLWFFFVRVENWWKYSQRVKSLLLHPHTISTSFPSAISRFPYFSINLSNGLIKQSRRDAALLQASLSLDR